jgi:APA family basic amino acid/polyamine antiporter
LVAISAVSVLGWERLSQSSAPFSDIAFAALGEQASFIVSVMALFATINTVLLMLLASSRIVYGMSESGSLPKILARIHPITRAPWAAIILVSALAMAFVFPEDIAFVANINNFTVFLTFIVINADQILLRYQWPEVNRPFQVPLSVGKLPLLPALAIILNAFMLLQLSLQVLAIGAGLTVLGFLAALISSRTA